jgi:beta-galactosidase
MKCTLVRFSILVIFFFGQTAFVFSQPTNRNNLFDKDWRFYKGDVPDGENELFNDKNWRTVQLPHDWSIEDLPNQSDTVIGPFSKNSIGGTSTGYTVGGIGWYRKHFSLPVTASKKVSIYFDGIYMNSDVWINGHHLGNHPYGYTGISYDLSPYINRNGKQNVIAVKVQNEGKNSRWYTGSGIYRHVWLTVTGRTFIPRWGVYITTPNVSNTAATVTISTRVTEPVANEPFTLQAQIKDATGKIVATSFKELSASADTAQQMVQTVHISNPHTWSPDHPYLYKAEISVLKKSKVVDREVQSFGVRSLQFSAAKGFLLNGKKTLLRGGCVHHDNGPLGAAAIDRAEERKVELLKSNGYNAVRTSHNPPSEAFLNACDRLGMLVIDEAFDQWQVPKNPQDYHLYFNEWWQRDIDAMVLRDRNHPSVIFWSIGNEINERADSSGLRIAKQLVQEVKRLDATRPVTEAICDFWDKRGYKWDTTTPAFSLLDVGGYNYKWQQYEADHSKFPERIMMGTETFAKEAFENEQQASAHSYVIGDFLWTAIDYMGETAIGHAELDTIKSTILPWPWFNAYCGDIDLIGGKKPQAWYRDVVWNRRKMAMLVHTPIPEGHKEAITQWGWPDEYPSWNFHGSEDRPVSVNVYTRYQTVQLELNGKVVGTQNASTETKYIASFMVNYQPGTLKSIAMEHGKRVDSIVLQTTGKPYKIKLIADRNLVRFDANDLSYVTAQIEDKNGRIIPDAVIPIHFRITGNGEIAATGNANPSEMASFQKPERNTFRGKCLAILRPSKQRGIITLKAEANGLIPAQIQIRTK